ncbi:MAG: LysM peptidoglycan-binding domain-containing protein [Anaerolineae bacterium]|nr:LysM peptidoglycan-binding domain-containing protein [Anaerolineae bacterium]
MRRLRLLILIGIALTLAAAPLRAQEDGSTGAGAAPVTHVVQAGETLFRIAMRYGVDVGAVALANGIADANDIYVGQELTIPGQAAIDYAGYVDYVVQPGDTLDTLARRYGVTVAGLAEINRLVRKDALFTGQTLRIAPPGDAPTAPPGYTYVVQPGDTLLDIAQRCGMALDALRQANGLPFDRTPLLYPGQRLTIPGDASAPPLRALPDPIIDFTLDPLPLGQGGAFSLRLTTRRPATIVGLFMGRSFALFADDGRHHAAVFGVDRLAPPGLHTLSVYLREAEDQLSAFETSVLVTPGSYGEEYIPVPARLQGILDPAVTGPELALLAQYMTPITPVRYWDGAFSAPSGGEVTSYFGTWRSYAGQFETYHAGMDYGAPAGAPVRAPAAGRVVFAGALEVRGRATILDHGWGVYSGYWHQSEVYVMVGDIVTPGQIIGLVGSTGLSTGPHLHWEVRVGGVPVDPLQWTARAFP